ncbi:MAG: DUF481 domain-containing protein [Pseudomonadales bacterium]
MKKHLNIALFSMTVLISNDLIAQENKELTVEETKKIEELNHEIQKITEEITWLTGTTAEQETAEKDNIWSGDVEFGYVDTSGNTEESTIKSRVDIKREKNEWRYNLLFDSLNSETKGKRSAEKYFFANRLAFQYSEYDYAFGYLSYDEDNFSGFDYQATTSAGYGRRLINNEVMQWDVEVGPGYRYSKVDDNSIADDSEEVILRAFSKYSWHFSDNADFSQAANIEAGKDNTISKSITALKVQVIGALSLKLSYTIKYTEDVPPGTRHADTETAVTLTYSF